MPRNFTQFSNFQRPFILAIQLFSDQSRIQKACLRVLGEGFQSIIKYAFFVIFKKLTELNVQICATQTVNNFNCFRCQVFNCIWQNVQNRQPPPPNPTKPPQKTVIVIIWQVLILIYVYQLVLPLRPLETRKSAIKVSLTVKHADSSVLKMDNG